MMRTTWWKRLDNENDLMMRTTWWWKRFDDEDDLMMKTTWWWRRLDDEDDLMMRTIYLSTLNWADKEFFLIFLYIASLGQTWQNPSNINPRVGLRALISPIRSNINPRVGFELLFETQLYDRLQRTSSAKTIKFFQILHFDLIICNKTFDETTCIAHFIDELIFFSWVYSLINHKKKTLLSIFKDLINQCDRIKFNKRAIIRIICID
jgi:hypothetical protein